MATHIHLIKLSVGTETVDGLESWQNSRAARTKGGSPCHVTRMWPKRESELLAGGSIYWVIKGVVQARQRILRLEEHDHGDGVRRCALIFDPALIRVQPITKAPFQGWRYLKPQDAPPDLPQHRAREESLPPKLSAALAEIGVR